MLLARAADLRPATGTRALMPDQRTATLVSPSCAQSPDPPSRILIRMRQRLAPSGLDRRSRPAHIGQHHFPHRARHHRANPSRGFLPWRFSDAGPRSLSRRRHGAGIRKPSQTRSFGEIRARFKDREYGYEPTTPNRSVCWRRHQIARHWAL